MRRHSTAAEIAAWLSGFIVLVLVLRQLSLGVTLPDDGSVTWSYTGAVVASRELLSKPDARDFIADYAGAYALTHGFDAYATTADLIAKVGMQWPVESADPHPPTTLTLVLPYSIPEYPRALGLWSLSMVVALALTLRLVGVRSLIAVAAAIGFAMTMPGAFAIGNPVPVIGLGIASAYHWRDRQWLPGLGVALATAPKLSGAVLLVPFALAARFRAVASAVFALAILGGIPLLLQHSVWTRYLSAGVQAITDNEGRPDNASLFRLLQHFQVPSIAALALIALSAVLLVLVSRDVFWPVAWVIVAALPVAWLSSLVTLIPIGAYIVLRRRSSFSLALVTLATGLAIASPPLGKWPVVMYPLVLGLVWLALAVAPREEEPPLAVRAFVPRAALRRLGFA